MPRSDLDFETRVGTPWTRRIQREQFKAFLSKCPVRNGDEPQEKENIRGTQGKRKNQRGKMLDEKVSAESPMVEKVSVKKAKTSCTNKSILTKGSRKEILKAKMPKSE
eukprot:scaffold184819_cov35-Attheya_sp.AAC.1